MTDDFAVRKNVLGLNAITGYQLPLGQRFMIEFYGGLGIRFRSVQAIGKNYNPDTDRLYTGIDITLDGLRKRTDAEGGFSTSVSIPFGLRFSYRF